MLYCEDALNKFLDDKSVDLFIMNPPLWIDGTASRYGGDDSKQLRESTYEGYLAKLMQVTKNLEAALKVTGSIVMIMPNTPLVFGYIPEVLKNTSLKLGIVRVWDWQGGLEYLVHFHKQAPYINPTFKLDNLIKELPNFMPEVSKYAEIGDVSGAIPEKIYELFINKYTEAGDVVADLFAGTGTVAAAAIKTGRKYIYNDSSSVQLEIAKERINDLQ